MKTSAIKSGEVLSNGAYTLPDFQDRTGLGRDAMRAARRKGLRVIRLHNRVFIRGSDWLDYLSKSVDATATESEL